MEVPTQIVDGQSGGGDEPCHILRAHSVGLDRDLRVPEADQLHEEHLREQEAGNA